MLVTNEDDAVVPGQSAQAKVSPVVLNATPEAAVEDVGPSGPLPSLLTLQEGDMTSQVWLNGEFRTNPWTQMMSRAPESPPDQPGDEVSDLESGMSDSESEGTLSHGYPASGIDSLSDVTDGYLSLGYCTLFIHWSHTKCSYFGTCNEGGKTV